MGLDNSEAEVSVIRMFEFVRENVTLNGPVTHVTSVCLHTVGADISFDISFSHCTLVYVPILQFKFVFPS